MEIVHPAEEGANKRFNLSQRFVTVMCCVASLLAGVLLHSHWILIFVVSLSIHLIIDNVQRRRRLFYFFIYRMVKRFDARYLLPEYFELRGKCKEGIR